MDRRERLTIKHSVSFSEKQAEGIKKIATELNCSFSEIVRICAARELPRLKERERKRKKAALVRKERNQCQ